MSVGPWFLAPTDAPRRRARVLRRPCAAAERLERRVLLSAELVKDINTATFGSSPPDLLPFPTPSYVEYEINGSVLYRANDGVHGDEWWSAPVPAAGTPGGPGEDGAMLLRDILPGPGSALANAYRARRAAAVLDDLLLFAADDGAGGVELWKTDGTGAGTTRVKDVAPGPLGSSPHHFVSVGSRVYFAAYSPGYGVELWGSDGTEAGTFMVADLTAGPGSTPDLVPLGGANGRLVFAARGPGGAGTELWVSDGRPGGNTSLLKDIYPGPTGSLPGAGYVDYDFLDRYFAQYEVVSASDGRIYFTASDAAHGRELWVTDGTPAGTKLAADAEPGAGSSGPRDLIDVGGTIYFVGNRSDTMSQPYVLHRFRPSQPAGVETVGVVGSGTYQLGSAGGACFVLAGPVGWVLSRNRPADPPSLEGLRLFDRAEAEEGLLRMAEVDGRLLFQLAVQEPDGGATGRGPWSAELWRSDGTAAGTELVRRSPSGGTPGRMLRAGPYVYYVGAEAATGREMHRTDGTPQGTRLVADVNRFNHGSVPGPLTWVNGRGLFAAGDADHGYELWSTDGTSDGTALVADIFPGEGGGLADDGRSLGAGLGGALGPVLNGRLYFIANDSPKNFRLWSTDGTAAGTAPVSGTARPNPAAGLTAFKGRVYFAGPLNRLWVSDGTEAGTTLFKQVRPIGDNEASQLTVVGDTMYFMARDQAHGRELWKTDGTPDGTALVADLTPGTGHTDLELFGGYNGRLVFGASAPDLFRLWTTDGTEAGTARLGGTDPLGFHSPRDVTVVNGRLLFTAMAPGGDPQAADEEVAYVSDGTDAGTARLHDVAPAAPRDLTLADLKSAGNAAFFFDHRFGETAADLWRTDGTADGTWRVKRLYGVSPREDLRRTLGGADGVMFLRVEDAAGSELWRSDGTADGTFRVRDVNPGPGGSQPEFVSAEGRRVYFAAYDPLHATELWSAPLHEPPPPATVTARHVFYNNSAFDGGSPDANAADDAAVARDKAALLPGQSPTFANVTSYVHGLNGVMVDVEGLPASAELTPDDFEVGGDGTRVGAVTVRRGAGVNGSDRVTLTWPDYDTPTDPPTIAVGNGWLTVTVKATANTGLARPDVFSFGNLVGETGDANPDPATGWRVNAIDLAAVKRALATGTVPVGSVADFNRDGRVNALDVATVKRLLTRSLPLPGAASAAPPPAVIPPSAFAAAPGREASSLLSTPVAGIAFDFAEKTLRPLMNALGGEPARHPS